MISELALNDIATFTQPTIIAPNKINFIFGSNGSGKTTIANTIADPIQTSIIWGTVPLKTLVYNKNFVDKNFGEPSEIGGIFTLGNDSKESIEFIATHRGYVDECTQHINGYSTTRDKLLRDQELLDSTIDNECWMIKGLFDSDFPEVFLGLNNSKRKFRTRCFEEAKNKKQSVVDIEWLTRSYRIAFGSRREIYNLLQPIDITRITEHEQCELLTQRICGSADTPIGKFIEYLGNSDWINAGLIYAEKAEGKCPFCNQPLKMDLYTDIQSFFDDSFNTSMKRLNDFLNDYKHEFSGILLKLQEYANNPIPFLNYELLKADTASLSLLISKNIEAIKGKIALPSVGVKLPSLTSALVRINEIIEELNKIIMESNDFALHQIDKQRECITAVWGVVIDKLANSMSVYNTKMRDSSVGIKKLDEQIEECCGQRKIYEQSIRERESTLTSVKPTAEAINSILLRFGFEGFRIIENADKRGTYRIIRDDGKCVNRTLSEGEYNFISFLYFYHLVYGSHEKTGVVQPKVVVIDDPISSLDSNVMFIVSTLTKQIIDDCRKDRNGIKQLFLLTHNVYFHKEISFLGSRDNWKKNEVAFWIVKKVGNISKVLCYQEKNPIQTTYELLWMELNDINNSKRITIFNTLRRILEYYFNVIGGLDYEKCINEFDGEDKLICRALISCINDGSHFITDDYVMQYENESVEKYVRVFRLIFEKMNQIDHYKMMAKEV